MSIAGKTYGNFVVEGPLEGAGGVYLAWQRGSPGRTDYVVKIVPLPKSTRAEPDGLAARKLDAIALQDRVAADWDGVVAPILDRPAKLQDVRDALAQGEAWFVTRRYDLSLKSYLEGLNGTPPSAELIKRICSAVTRGSLAFKQSGTPGGGRRSHGNLKPSNVLIRGVPLRLSSELVVMDPALGARTDQTLEARRDLETSYEQLDLESVGRILFQLVAGRLLPDNWNWAQAWSSPEAKPTAWRKVFGKNAGKWRELCQRLLAPDSGATRLTLSGLEAELENMPVTEPGLRRPGVWVIASAVVLIAIAFFILRNRKKEGQILIKSNVEELDVIVQRKGDLSGPAKARLSSGQGAGQFVFKSAPGVYDLEITPTGLHSNLPPRKATVDLESGKEVPLQMEFEFAPVEFASNPEATVEWHRLGKSPGVLGRTPFTTILPAGEYYFVFTNAGYLNKSVWADLAETNKVTAIMEKQYEGELTLDLRSEVDRRFHKTVFLLNDQETERFFSFKPHLEYKLKVIPPMPWQALETNLVLPPKNSSYTFSPAYGTVFLDYRDPILSKAEVWLTGSDPEGKLGLVGEELFRLPPGSHQLQFDSAELGSSTVRVDVKPGTTNTVPVKLEPPPVSLTLTTSLDGTQVLTNGQPAGVIGPNASAPLLLKANVEHRIEITFSNVLGALPSEQIRIRGTPSQQITTNVPLKYGILVFKIQPSTATIRRGGEKLPATVAVQAPGKPVEYEFSAPNHRSVTKIVEVADGDAKTIEAVLSKL